MSNKYFSALAILGLAVFMSPFGVNAQNTNTVPPSVQISSIPAATAIEGSEFSTVDVQVGDTVDFIRVSEGTGIINSSWNWYVDKTKLSCAGYPDFDSDTLRCKALATGSSTVSIEVVFYLSDGTKSTQGSNLITVNVGQINTYLIATVTSNPPAPNGYLSLKVGDTVNFAYSEKTNYVSSSGGLSWNYDRSKLSCTFPTMEKLNCTVIADGNSSVSATSISNLNNGLKRTDYSNKIILKVGAASSLAPLQVLDTHVSSGSIAFDVKDAKLSGGDRYFMECTEVGNELWDKNPRQYRDQIQNNVSGFIQMMVGNLKGGVSYNCYVAVAKTSGEFARHSQQKIIVAQDSIDNEAIDEQEISEGQPDLIISVARAILVKRFFRGGVTKKQYKVGVTVKNIGVADADGPFYVSFSNGTKGTPVLVTKGTLGVDKSKKVFLYVDTSEKGKKLTFTVDADNVVDESNEYNNTATRIVGK